MKRYINCYPGEYTTVHRSAEEAQEYHGDDVYAVAVEIELPDPPHEWKVGDWFRFHPGWSSMCIAYIGAGVAACFGRSPDVGKAIAYEYPLATLDQRATPCDPPTWFTEDGAS